MVWKPVPPTVEHISSHHHEGVLQTQLPLRVANKPIKDKLIEQKHYRQEYGELDGVEENIVPCFAGARAGKKKAFDRHIQVII